MIEQNAEQKTEFVRSLAQEINQPVFYIQLKAARYGLSREKIVGSIAEDQLTCQKIASSINRDEKTVFREFIGQLSNWRATFRSWKLPMTPEEMVLNSLKNILAQRYIGKTVRLAVVISMDKTKVANSSQSSKFRWLQILVEPDNPEKPWEVKRVIHWGAAPTIDFGAPYDVVLQEKGGFTTLVEISPSNKKLPDVIPGDIRARCRLIARGQPYTRRGISEKGEYELEGIFLTLVVDNKDGTSSILEGSSLRPDKWISAPHGKVLNTTIIKKKEGYINIGDWHEAKDQTPIEFPKDIPVLVDLSDETAEQYIDEFVIYDGIPSRYWVSEGEKGPVQLLSIESFFSDPTTVRILNGADIDKSLLVEEDDGITIFDAPRIKVLCKVQHYQKGQQVRLSRSAYAIWAITEDESSSEEVVLPEEEPKDDSLIDKSKKMDFSEDPLLDNMPPVHHPPQKLEDDPQIKKIRKSEAANKDGEKIL